MAVRWSTFYCAAATYTDLIIPDLPRNGIVTAGQVVSAVSEGFNMGAGQSSPHFLLELEY
jgi:hypothetical protein